MEKENNKPRDNRNRGRSNRKDYNDKPRHNSLNTTVEIELLQPSDNLITATNAVLFGKYANLPKDYTMGAGLSVIHGTVAMSELFSMGLPLVEGSIRQIIGGLISQIGYTPTPEMVEENYEDLENIIDLSADAHALLMKMWLIQNGRQATDVLNANMGSAFFFYPSELQFNEATKELNGSVTSFDKNISNAVWQQEYVGQLQYTYTTAVMRATLTELFASVKELSEGYSATNSYLNLWPSTIRVSEEGDSLDAIFKSRVDTIRDITQRNPLITQILSYLDFQTGTDFDYTRSLDQRRLVIQEDSVLAEFLAANSHTFAPGNAGEEEQREQDLIARRVLLEDNTPLDVTSSVSIEKITLANLLRGIVQLSFMTEFRHAFKNGKLQDSKTTAMICLLNYHVQTTAKNGSFVYNLTKYLNQLALNQVDMIDFDSTYQIELHLEGETEITGWHDSIVLAAGYGTFIIDESSLNLARQETSLSVCFGARYKDSFVKKLNAIPTNIIKTL